MPAVISHSLASTFSAAIRWNDFSYAIVESDMEVKLFTVAEHFQGEAYDAGILFGQSAELRWRRRRSGLFHTVLIDDRGGEGTPLESVDDESQFMLWGERHGGASAPSWYEGRIPRIITEYPDLPGKRVAVRLRTYWLRHMVPQPNGEPDVAAEVHLLRCVDLVDAALED
jgi:hypothetical protein